jgi:hypothetical protein
MTSLGHKAGPCSSGPGRRPALARTPPTARAAASSREDATHSSWAVALFQGLVRRRGSTRPRCPTTCWRWHCADFSPACARRTRRRRITRHPRGPASRRAGPRRGRAGARTQMIMMPHSWPSHRFIAAGHRPARLLAPHRLTEKTKPPSSGSRPPAGWVSSSTSRTSTQRTRGWHLPACGSSRHRAPDPTATSPCFSTSPATNGTLLVRQRKTASSHFATGMELQECPANSRKAQAVARAQAGPSRPDSALSCRVEVRPGTTGHRVAEHYLGPRRAGWLYDRFSRYCSRSQTAADRRRCRRKSS